MEFKIYHFVENYLSSFNEAILFDDFIGFINKIAAFKGFVRMRLHIL